MSLSAFFSSLPPPHPNSPTDIAIALASKYLVILSLLTPPTPFYKLLRAGIVAPLVIAGFAYSAYWPIQKDYEDVWGTPILACFFSLRVLELLVFFPAEENLYRLKPSKRFELKHTPSATSDEHTNGLSNGHTTTTSKADLVAEPLPPPWTMAKFWWASSLWWSWRGIGWNYTCSLPTTSRSHPFSHSSSRLAYIRRRLTFYILGWFLHDLTRSFMNVGPYSSFFGGHQGAPNYNDLSVGQKALFSICVVTRIVTGMEESSVACGLIFVSIGGVMGWEGEFWSPWGWPPIYGSLADLWRHPGLSSMWSRTWHQYFRRWLYTLGWIGIGEKILRLPRTGPPARSPPPGSSVDSAGNTITPAFTPGPTPSASGRTSPSHPLPTEPPPPRPSRTFFPRIMLANLLKSLIVFTMTAGIHEQACFILLLHTNPAGKTVHWTDAIVTTPFFVLQPFALAFEAAVKSAWRGWKIKHHSNWRKSNTKHAEPAWLVFLERLVGFVWTWWWIGWSAGWFVRAVTRIGLFRRGGDQAPLPSFFGGVLWGKWRH